MERAFEVAQRAIALDDSLSLPHQVLSQVYVGKKQYDQAIVEAERAIALDPNDADGYVVLGNTLAFAGRPEEGIGLIEKAMRLNPRYPPRYLNLLGLAYRTAGRYTVSFFKPALTSAGRRGTRRDHNQSWGEGHRNFFSHLSQELAWNQQAILGHDKSLVLINDGRGLLFGHIRPRMDS